jgi:hypothetical protein
MTVVTPRRVWEPQAGSQALFLASPVFETLYDGTRGVGKTDALLMRFAQHVDRGFGSSWRGVIFRREYKQLDEIVTKSKRWFHRIFPRARFKESLSSYKWVWPAGEELLFRSFKDERDYDDFHGHEYPFIGWEELTKWPTLKGYHLMKACCRSAHPDVPRIISSTTNPYGVGHNTVKAYFVDPAPAGVPVQDDHGLWRVRVRGHWSENRILLAAQPNYPAVIAASARNPEERKAWLDGNWDIVAGGMFDDLWREAVHVLRQPYFAVPRTWRIDRAFDWGSSAPFSVGWWAEANGEDVAWPDGRTRAIPRGTLIRIGEWYGCREGEPNVGLGLTDEAIAQGIVQRETQLGIRARVRPGPADSSIFDVEPGNESTADKLRRGGAGFVRGDKRPGSRVNGWQAIRGRLEAALAARPEQPCLYVLDRCRDFIRTVPVLPRDDKNPDDVDTEAEDHIADETRYRVLAGRREGTLTEIHV